MINRWNPTTRSRSTDSGVKIAPPGFSGAYGIHRTYKTYKSYFFAGVGFFCPDGGVHCAEPILWAGKKDEKDKKDKTDRVSLA